MLLFGGSVKFMLPLLNHFEYTPFVLSIPGHYVQRGQSKNRAWEFDTSIIDLCCSWNVMSFLEQVVPCTWYSVSTNSLSKFFPIYGDIIQCHLSCHIMMNT